MRERLIAGLIVIAGVINVLPVFGAVSAARIEALYGVEVANAATEVLLRHRAILFGLVGAFMILGAFRKPLQPFAIVGGLISMLSFLALYYTVGPRPAGLHSIMIADWVGIAALLVALPLSVLRR